MRRLWAGWGRDTLKELGKLDVGHVVAAVITSASFLILLLMNASQLGSF
jgi:hypothetical protein